LLRDQRPYQRPPAPQLSAGLSTESARKAAEQSGGSPDVDQDTSIAAKYYVQQLLAMDEGGWGDGTGVD
jgi:hypothetical protein